MCFLSMIKIKTTCFMVHFNVSSRPALMMRRVNRPKYVWLFFSISFPSPVRPSIYPPFPDPKCSPSIGQFGIYKVKKPFLTVLSLQLLCPLTWKIVSRSVNIRPRQCLVGELTPCVPVSACQFYREGRRAESAGSAVNFGVLNQTV